MTTPSGGTEFHVSLTLCAAGPVRPRTKYKDHKLLRAEKQLTLPFVPYPGLYLTFSRPTKRRQTETLYLRVRTVEWQVTEKKFECVVDEVMGSLTILETMEVRGGECIESQFVQLQKTLRGFEFDVSTDVDALYVALDKQPDGSVIKPMP